MQAEPTFTPGPDDERFSVVELPIGEPGHYVNVTFGYQLQYPPTWYTGFGNRPVLVSFSSLDPGTHNRLSMRQEGCLIEVRATTNVAGLTIQEVRAQLAKVLGQAEALELDGEEALRLQESNKEEGFESEWVLVEHEDLWFHLSLNHATGLNETCGPAWGELLTSWRWFEPELAVYRNQKYGYAFSHPRRWYRFLPRERGISVSSQDPTDVSDLAELPDVAMLVDTDVFDNEEDLPLKEWVAAQDGVMGLTNGIPLEGMIGVRVLKEGPTPGSQEMSGYFQGPLGKIYVVRCLYPAERQWEFRPIANAVLYSFSF